MSFEKRTGARSHGLDIDAKPRDRYLPGDRIFLKPTGHGGEIQVTLATGDSSTLQGQVSGYCPPLAVSAEPPDYPWGSLETFSEDEIQHHEYGA